MNERLVAYVSDQAHSSLARGARMLGFRPDQVRVLPVGDDCRLAPGDARRGDRGRRARPGALPFFVSANGGATNTGAIDPLPSSREVCRERGSGCTSTPPTAGSRR